MKRSVPFITASSPSLRLKGLAELAENMAFEHNLDASRIHLLVPTEADVMGTRAHLKRAGTRLWIQTRTLSTWALSLPVRGEGNLDAVQGFNVRWARQEQSPEKKRYFDHRDKAKELAKWLQKHPGLSLAEIVKEAGVHMDRLLEHPNLIFTTTDQLLLRVAGLDSGKDELQEQARDQADLLLIHDLHRLTGVNLLLARALIHSSHVGNGPPVAVSAVKFEDRLRLDRPGDKGLATAFDERRPEPLQPLGEIMHVTGTLRRMQAGERIIPGTRSRLRALNRGFGGRVQVDEEIPHDDLDALRSRLQAKVQEHHEQGRSLTVVCADQAVHCQLLRAMPQWAPERVRLERHRRKQAEQLLRFRCGLSAAGGGHPYPPSDGPDDPDAMWNAHEGSHELFPIFPNERAFFQVTELADIFRLAEVTPPDLPLPEQRYRALSVLIARALEPTVWTALPHELCEPVADTLLVVSEPMAPADLERVLNHTLERFTVLPLASAAPRNQSGILPQEVIIADPPESSRILNLLRGRLPATKEDLLALLADEETITYFTKHAPKFVPLRTFESWQEIMSLPLSSGTRRRLVPSWVSLDRLEPEHASWVNFLDEQRALDGEL